jgi:regulator of protease activity HflC (stomatin/prohibitin superfamily)
VCATFFEPLLVARPFRVLELRLCILPLLEPATRERPPALCTREYPYNAPIREAPTASRVNASVDLFLQFRIEDPAEFIFTVGGVKGFSDKLENAISEVTRALIYEQRAEDIYDLDRCTG